MIKKFVSRIFKKGEDQNKSDSVQLVRDYYELWHDRYLKSFGVFFQSAQLSSDTELANHILAKLNLKKNDLLLDAGCGVGGPAVLFAKFGGVKVKGITLSKKQADFANNLIAENKLKDSVEIIEGDFHHLSKNYVQNEFNGIVFLESLVHSSNPLKVLKEADKILKIGGVLYIKDLFTRINYPKNEEKRILTAQKNTNKFCSLFVRPSKEIIEILNEMGYKLVEYNNLAENMNHDIGNAFVMNNQLDIFEGEEPIEYLEWAELIFRKNG